MSTVHASATLDFANEQTECGFFLRGNADFPDGNRDGNFRPPLRRQILHLVPMAVRYFFHWVNMVVFKKKVPSIDAVNYDDYVMQIRADNRAKGKSYA